METKYVRVPFEVELAKRIQNKECEGRIVTREGIHVRVVCWDKIDDDSPIVALLKYREKEVVETFMIDGRWHCEGDEESNLDLLLEIPEYMTFKDGDVIAFGDKYTFIGIFKSSWAYNESHSDYVVLSHEDRLMFDGDAWTYNNARFATESEKQKLIDALKSSKDQRAKKYVKRFFPNHSNSSKIGKDCKFNPFDKVLVRDSIRETWVADIFSNYRKDPDYSYTTLGGSTWKCCIPYNEQTAHLLGTTKSPD
ncbi:hypothetical protein [Bacteroides ndongoniae]|jgi:hypothetical protein|uniref:hypothetical protein n=1 Tax=Bacteroides ndongoniae TaxID=1903262 RepID=UPI0023F89BD7|nr:hypothetical protein [Bacteroides ndongoniae]